MTKLLKRLFVTCGILSAFSLPLAASTAQIAFAEGCSAYADGDWDSAVSLLKKAVGYSENVNPDTYYMLISSEMNAGENEEALDYCDFFLNNFSSSVYVSRIQYFKGRTLYNLGEYERAILELSDFCHQYENDDMYPNALFYIGEALYSGYKYDEASSIYERIITDYPSSDKAVAAQYRIDSIAQRSREEKLLYLLKQTGEEYLSSKEEYEKQLKMYNSETVYSARQRLLDSQQKNSDLEKQIADLEAQIEALNREVQDAENQKNEYAAKAAAAIEEKETLQKEVNQANEDKTAAENAVKEAEQLSKEQNEVSEAEKAKLERLKLLKLKALEAQKKIEDGKSE